MSGIDAIARGLAAQARALAAQAVGVAGVTNAAGQGYVPVTLTSSDGNALAGTVPLGVTVGPRSMVGFTANASNTAAATLTIAGTSRAILDRSGTAVVAGELASGVTYTGEVSSGGSSIRLLGAAPASNAQIAAGTNITAHVHPAGLAYALANAANTSVALTSSDGNTLAGTTPFGQSLGAGQLLSFSANAVSSGAATLALNGAAAKSIYNRDGTALAAGQLVTGTTYQLVATSSAYKLVGPVPATAAQIDAGTNAVGFVTPAGLAYSLAKKRDAKLMYCAFTGNAAKIFMPGAVSNYTEVRYVRATGSLAGTIGYDTWKINGVYDDSGFAAYSATRVQQLVALAECEFAAHEYGVDFSGGSSHGGELMTSVVMRADGKTFDPSATLNFACYELQVWRKSTIYRHDTSSTVIGTLWLVTTFRAGEILFQHMFVPVAGIVFDRIHQGLLPWVNQLAPVAGGGPVTVIASAVRSPLVGDPEAIGASGFSPAYTKDSQVIGYGGTYSLGIEMLSGLTNPNWSTWIEWLPADGRSKPYTNLVGANTATSAAAGYTSDGSAISSSARITIRNPN